MKPATTPQLDLLLSSLTAGGASCQPVLDVLLASIGDGVAITDAAGSSLYFNPAARRILGIEAGAEPASLRAHAESLYYLSDFSPVPEEELPLARALRGEESKDVQLFARSAALPDGAVVYLSAGPIRDASGSILGGVAVFHDAGARKRAEEELCAANAKLAAWVGELERRANVIVLTNEMADLLQSCRTMKEFYLVVSRFAARIFERESGAVFIVNPSRSAIEMVASWGSATPAERVFRPDACWALRRGRIHRAGGGALGPDCDHTSSDGTSGYTCIPMMGQGEALGVLHVQMPAEEAIDNSELDTLVVESRQRTIITVAEHIGLALANLKLRETLRAQAIRDPLTGLFNRRYMEESLDREIARASRSGSSVAVMMIDLDHFKRFNDTFGHAAADIALRETASILRSQLRPDDIACRFGGEELVVILPDTSREHAARAAEGLRLAVSAQQIRYQGAALGAVTASFGVATSQGHATTGEALLRAADVALYRAKKEGRDRVCAEELTATTPNQSRRPPASLPAPVSTRISLFC